MIGLGEAVSIALKNAEKDVVAVIERQQAEIARLRSALDECLNFIRDVTECDCSGHPGEVPCDRCQFVTWQSGLLAGPEGGE
jgi:hypothetical protein